MNFRSWKKFIWTWNNRFDEPRLHFLSTVTPLSSNRHDVRHATFPAFPLGNRTEMSVNMYGIYYNDFYEPFVL